MAHHDLLKSRPSHRPPSRPFRLAPLALAVILMGSASLGNGRAAPVMEAESAEHEEVDPDAGARTDDQGELRLSDVKSGRSISQGRDALNPLRADALKESALVYGARAGLYARMREINRILDEEAGVLDKNFPFAPLILSHHVAPPVIQSGLSLIHI